MQLVGTCLCIGVKGGDVSGTIKEFMIIGVADISPTKGCGFIEFKSR